MFELHLPIFVRAQVNLTMGLMGTEEAVEEFKKSLECIEKSLGHLKYECEGTFGYNLRIGAEDSYQQLKHLVQQIEATMY